MIYVVTLILSILCVILLATANNLKDESQFNQRFFSESIKDSRESREHTLKILEELVKLTEQLSDDQIRIAKDMVTVCNRILQDGERAKEEQK